MCPDWLESAEALHWHSFLCGIRAAARGLFNMSTQELLQHISKHGFDTGPDLLRLFDYHKVG